MRARSLALLCVRFANALTSRRCCTVASSLLASLPASSQPCKFAERRWGHGGTTTLSVSYAGPEDGCRCAESEPEPERRQRYTLQHSPPQAFHGGWQRSQTQLAVPFGRQRSGRGTASRSRSAAYLAGAAKESRA